MDGLKNEHYFGNPNQNNNRSDNSYAREAFDALNYQGGFPANGRALAQSMQNMQNMQTMQNMQNMQNFSGQGGMPNLQGLPGFSNFQGMQNMMGNPNAQNQANLFNMNMNSNHKDDQGRGPAQSMQRQQDMGRSPAPLAGMTGRQGGSNNQGGMNMPNLQALQDMQGMQGMQGLPPQMADFDPQAQLPSEEHNLNYYHEFCRLHVANVVLNTQMNELIQEKNELLARLTTLEKKSEELQRSQSNYYPLEDKKKRFRRTATEIDRHYICPIESCQKSYGSEGSLNQHLKLKHPEYKIPSEHNGSEAGSTARGE